VLRHACMPCLRRWCNHHGYLPPRKNATELLPAK
jgi:hypothetical protein